MTTQLTLNNGVTMPAIGLGVFQTSPDETTASAESVETKVAPTGPSA